MKKLAILLFLISFNVFGSYTTIYDIDFHKWSKYYLPLNHWTLLKSQCIAESNLILDAVSPVKAKGLCQFMDPTWKDVSKQLKINGNVFDPKINIQFAAYYMMKMNNFWKSPRPLVDRNNLSLASYNAGAGNLHKSQIMCNNSVLYEDIIKCLPCVTFQNSKETINYVIRIRRIDKKLILGY